MFNFKTKSKIEKTLKYSLIAGMVYFICMAIAHFFGFKYPLLFVYYDVPFYAYQDKIISFSVLSYVCLFYAALRHKDIVPVAILLMFLTFCGLSAVNLSIDLKNILNGGSTQIYWLQTILIAIYTIWLNILYLFNKK